MKSKLKLQAGDSLKLEGSRSKGTMGQTEIDTYSILNEKGEVVGSVEHEHMTNIYAAHDFIVVPSIHETFSLVCAEALACGRPVIATRCGGPEEVIPQGGGILVPVGDVTALSCALLDALSGEIEFDAQKNIDYVVSTFSLDRLINELENVYANLIETGD